MLPHDTENYGFREIAIPGSTIDLQRQRAARAAEMPQFQEPSDSRGDLTPRGPGPWELYRLSSDTPYRALVNRDRSQAEREARTSLSLRGDNPADFGIRTRQDQPAAPGNTGRELLGWSVRLPSGEEVTQIRGGTQMG